MIVKVNSEDLAGPQQANPTLYALILALIQSGDGTYTKDLTDYDSETNTGTQKLVFTFKQDPRFLPCPNVTVVVGFEEGAKDDTYTFEIQGLEPGEHYSS